MCVEKKEGDFKNNKKKTTSIQTHNLPVPHLQTLILDSNVRADTLKNICLLCLTSVPVLCY